ncbi:hypothetical protein SLS62_004637 [Diatrype stigma]|uniref:Uncharacterized protein n=1 Tax=Diatrype stigma TaxID=117547 RepID=A0AAN9YSV9_9PEZI
MSDDYDGPDAIVDENLDEVDQDCDGAHLDAWINEQMLLEFRDHEGNISTRVWDADFAAADALVPFFFGRGGRMLHELAATGVTLHPAEYQRVAQELQPEVDDMAAGYMSVALGYPVVGVVNTNDVSPEYPYVWVFFVPAIEPFGTPSVIPPGRHFLWHGLLQYPRHINDDNIRTYMANEAARELRRRFRLVTGFHVGIPVSADPAAHDPRDGVDLEDADDILVPDILEGDDRYFVAVELDGPEEVADESEEEDGEDDEDDYGEDDEDDYGEDDEEDDAEEDDEDDGVMDDSEDESDYE